MACVSFEVLVHDGAHLETFGVVAKGDLDEAHAMLVLMGCDDGAPPWHVLMHHMQRRTEEEGRGK